MNNSAIRGLCVEHGITEKSVIIQERDDK